MRETFFYGVMLFCSAYGIFSLIFFLRAFFGEKKYLRGKCVYTLLLLKDEDCCPEEMVRALLFQNYKNDTGICDRKIIVVTDDKSSCNARKITRFFEDEREVLVCNRDSLVSCLEK